jgi:hypothetical protein
MNNDCKIICIQNSGRATSLTIRYQICALNGWGPACDTRFANLPTSSKQCHRFLETTQGRCYQILVRISMLMSYTVDNFRLTPAFWAFQAYTHSYDRVIRTSYKHRIWGREPISYTLHIQNGALAPLTAPTTGLVPSKGKARPHISHLCLICALPACGHSRSQSALLKG